MGVPVTGTITTTSPSDTYATIDPTTGLGGKSEKTTLALRNAIPSARRVFGMIVTVNSDSTPANNGTYMLANVALGGVNDTLTDNSNWIAFGGSSLSGLTTNSIPKATSSSTIGNSTYLTENATGFGINVSAATLFHLKGIDATTTVSFRFDSSTTTNLINFRNDGYNSFGGSAVTNNRVTIIGGASSTTTFGFVVHNSTGTNNAFLVRDDGFSSFGVLPVTSTRVTINSTGTTSSTFPLQVHNSTGSNNSLLVRSDGFLSMGSTVVTNVRLNIQSTGTSSATFPLRLDNSTPSPIAYFRSDRRVAIGTSTFSGIFTIDGNNQSSTDGLVIRNIDNGIMLNIIGGSTIASGVSIDTSAAFGISALNSVADISGYAFTLTTGGALTGNTSSDTVNASRGNTTLNGFDVQGAILRLDDNIAGISGDIMTVTKSSVNVFNIDTNGKTLFMSSTTSSASVTFRSGTAPTSPVDGDMWYDGTNVKFRIGAVTKTFTLV